MRVATVITSPVKTIEGEAPLCQAYDLMQRHRIKHLPVVQAQQIVGLITAQHIRGVNLGSIRAHPPAAPPSARDRARVYDIMIREVVTLHPDTSAHDVARLAWERNIGCFLVIEGETLLGIVTTTDLLDLFIDQLEADHPTQYEHLLLATDFKPAAARALPTAMSLVQRHRAKLSLVHVLPHLTRFLATDIEHTSAETVAMLVDAGQAEALTRLKALVPSALGDVSYRVVHGDPATAIINTAMTIQADLIILGQRQHRRPYGLRRGVTKRVIQRARCPILLVQTEVHYEFVRP